MKRRDEKFLSRVCHANSKETHLKSVTPTNHGKMEALRVEKGKKVSLSEEIKKCLTVKSTLTIIVSVTNKSLSAVHKNKSEWIDG